VGVPYTLGFSATVPGSDPVTGWTINWGDGTTTNYPSDASSETHTYLNPNTYAINVTANDGVGSGGSASEPVTVSVGAQSVTAGGPYLDQSGQGVTLTAVATGDVTAFAWDINGDGVYNDGTPSPPVTSQGVTTGQLTLTWAQLQSLLKIGTVANDVPQTLSNVTVRATYAAAGNPTATSPATTLTILDTPPTAVISSVNGTVGQAGSATITLSNPYSPSAALTSAGFTYSFDFNDNGVFDGSDIVNSPSPTAALPLSDRASAHL